MTRAVVINPPTPVFWGFIGKDEKKRAADLSLHISLTPLSQLGNTGLLPFLGEKNKLKPKGEDTGLGSQSPRSMGAGAGTTTRAVWEGLRVRACAWALSFIPEHQKELRGITITPGVGSGCKALPRLPLNPQATFSLPCHLPGPSCCLCPQQSGGCCLQSLG